MYRVGQFLSLKFHFRGGYRLEFLFRVEDVSLKTVRKMRTSVNLFLARNHLVLDVIVSGTVPMSRARP